MKCKECTNINVTGYEQPLNAQIARVVSFVAGEGGKADFQNERAKAHGNNTTNASYFGLLVNVGDRIWELTPKGKEWFIGNERVPSWIRYYYKEVYEYSDQLITIKQALQVESRYKFIDPPEWLLKKRRHKHFRQMEIV